jgi:HEXXH motif-containing protein
MRGAGVRIRKAPGPLSSGMLEPAEIDDPRLDDALTLLERVWPAALDEADEIVEGIYPAIFPGLMARGHFSGIAEPGWIYVSVNDPVGCAEGILHEMGHLKLISLGIGFERAWAVIANDPADLYESPIRKDKRRPMTAVLHGLYSYLYVTEFDQRGVALGLVDTETWHLNQARIIEGTATLEAHVRTTPAGRAFIESVIAWGHRLGTA